MRPEMLKLMGIAGVGCLTRAIASSWSLRTYIQEEKQERMLQLGMYLNIQPTITNWAATGDEFSLIFETNPLAEFVELPSDIGNLRYSAILCGCIRGALEMVQLEVQSWFAQDHLKGDANTEIRVKFIRRLEDAIPAGED